VDSYTQYVYDAGGTRVAKGASASLTCGAPGTNFSLTNQYLVGLGGEQVTELDGWGDWLHTDVWAGGRLLATYDGFGIHFPLTDPLGTKRIQANAYGAVDETCFSLPYGDGLNCIGDDATEHHFTGKERDAESGNDYFGARYYSSAMGRFMSPDWSAKEDPVPYAKLDNPQTLNLYSYVQNNPLSRIDSDGHQEEKDPKEEAREEADFEVWLREATTRLREMEAQREQEEINNNARNAPTLTPQQAQALDKVQEFVDHYRTGTGGRWGGSPTRSQNVEIADVLESGGYKVTNGAGRGPEEWIPGPTAGSGGTFVDITARKGDATVRIQTVTTLADGKTLTPGEQAAAARIRQAYPKDQLILIPKQAPRKQ